MKLKNKISWLMGRVPKSLFHHLNECFDSPLTEQEERLVSILEIVQVEKYFSKCATGHWRGRKPFDRQNLARALVAKTLYGLLTTIDFIRALHLHREMVVGQLEKKLASHSDKKVTAQWAIELLALKTLQKVS